MKWILVLYHHLSPVEQQGLATLTSLITVLVGLRGSGVTLNIKLNFTGIYSAYDCGERTNNIFETDLAGNETGDFPSYQELNDKCEMIPQHGGDLRAEWIDFVKIQ